MEFVTACLLKIIPPDTSNSDGNDSFSINKIPSAKPSSTAFLALNQLSASIRCDIFARESPVFTAERPLEKAVTDITEIQTADGKLYISIIEDCFDNAVLGLSMADNMKAGLCVDTLKSAIIAYPGLRGAIIHSDRGSQYTSYEYRQAIEKYGIIQSMNSAGGRCHDNAKCESLWGRFKEELLYDRYDAKKMSMAAVKSLIWRYFMSYWNNRRICSANGGLPPMVKRKKFYERQYAKTA